VNLHLKCIFCAQWKEKPLLHYIVAFLNLAEWECSRMEPYYLKGGLPVWWEHKGYPGYRGVPAECGVRTQVEATPGEEVECLPCWRFC
jgi:hypothetical protein